MIAHRDAMKRSESGSGSIFQRIRLSLLGGEIGGPNQAKPVDEQLLLLRAAAHQAAIFELGSGERAEKPGFGTRQTRNCALHR